MRIYYFQELFLFFTYYENIYILLYLYFLYILEFGKDGQRHSFPVFFK